MNFETAIQVLQSKNFPLHVDFYGRLLAGYGGRVIRNSMEEPEELSFPHPIYLNPNYNKLIIGGTEAGKTHLMKTLAAQELAQGKCVIVLGRDEVKETLSQFSAELHDLDAVVKLGKIAKFDKDFVKRKLIPKNFYSYRVALFVNPENNNFTAKELIEILGEICLASSVPVSIHIDGFKEIIKQEVFMEFLDSSMFRASVNIYQQFIEKDVLEEITNYMHHLVFFRNFVSEFQTFAEQQLGFSGFELSHLPQGICFVKDIVEDKVFLLKTCREIQGMK